MIFFFLVEDSTTIQTVLFAIFSSQRTHDILLPKLGYLPRVRVVD